jgi:hypothetical protein
VNDGILDPQLGFYSDEAWFHLFERVNSQNNQYLSSVNPRLTHEMALPDPKVGVWCAISSQQTIRPIFFCETINSYRYIAHIFNQCFPQLTKEERLYSYFQQDGAVAHTARNLLNAIFDVFDDRVISY